MSGPNNGVEVDTLFVACTRPATYWGVPFTAFIFELIVVMEVFIFTKNLLALAWGIPVHGIVYLICLKEPRIFELFILWGMTKFSRFMNGSRKLWKTNTYSPLTIHVGRTRKHLRRSIKL